MDYEDRILRVREHPAYRLLDEFVIDYDLRQHNVRAYQKSSEQAKSDLMMKLLDELGIEW